MKIALPASKAGWERFLRPAGLKALLLIASVLAAYSPAWHAGFIWDDDAYVTANPFLTASDGLKRIWFSFDSPSQYFPLTYTVFRLEHGLWGLNSTGYHCFNILLHAANALLLWRVLRRLKVPGAWMAAAVWALHPVQVESVAWVTELKNVMMCFFFLLALLAWIRFIGTEEGAARKWIFYSLTLACYSLALFSKTTACTFPAALLLVLWLQGRLIDWRRLIQISPFVVLGVGMGLVTTWVERHHMGIRGEMFSMGILDRILVASRAVWFYAGKLLWPGNLMFSYPRWTVSASNPRAYLGLAGMAVCGAGVAYARRYTGRAVEVALLFFVTTLSPVLGFIMLYTFLWSFVADHYQYVASLGLIGLAVAGAVVLFAQWKIKAMGKLACCGALLLLLGTLTWRQCGMYADSETLWTTTIRQNPDSWLARNNLGLWLYGQGKLDEAIDQFRRVVEINPNYEVAYYNLGNAILDKGNPDAAMWWFQKALQIEPHSAEAMTDLGNAYLRKGAIDEAIRQYESALRLKPDYALAHNNLGNVLLKRNNPDAAMAEYLKALQADPNYADACFNLGNVLSQKGDIGHATEWYEKALKLKPDDAAVCIGLGNALLEQRRADDAIAQYEKALRFAPRSVEARNNLGNAFLQKGSVVESIAAYQAALRIDSNSVNALNNLAWVLAVSPDPSLRDGRRAVELALRASRLTGGEDPGILGTLAAAYGEAGRFPEAINTAQNAIQLAERQSDTGLANSIGEQLKLLQSGIPYHLPQH